MTAINEVTPTEQADCLAIRELIDAYAHCADRRDAEGQKSLFIEDTRWPCGRTRHVAAWRMCGWTPTPSKAGR
jgi:hypothetical protein